MRDCLQKQNLEHVPLKDKEKFNKEIEDQKRRILDIQHKREYMKNQQL